MKSIEPGEHLGYDSIFTASVLTTPTVLQIYPVPYVDCTLFIEMFHCSDREIAKSITKA